MDHVLFAAFSVLAVVAALLAVTRKNAVASACWLVAMFFGLAGVFVLQEAYFVATTQILVYAGAIMVLFLFVIMLLDLRSVELSARAGPRLRFAGVLLAGLFLAGVLYAVRDAMTSPRVADRVGAVLRLPAPPVAPDPEDPLKAVEAPSAPPPRTLVFEADDGTGVGAGGGFSRPDEGELPEPGDRVYAAEVDVPDAAGTVARKRLRLAVAPDGAMAVRWDGVLLPPPTLVADDGAAGQGASIRRGRIELPGTPPGTPPGTVLDLTLVRGGLAASPGGGPDGSARAIGRSIFEFNLLPFEVASVLLTGAIFGAVVLTKRRLS